MKNKKKNMEAINGNTSNLRVVNSQHRRHQMGSKSIPSNFVIVYVQLSTTCALPSCISMHKVPTGF
jgi:hypothetical protein